MNADCLQPKKETNYMSSEYRIPLTQSREAVLRLPTRPLYQADLDIIKQWIDLMEANLTESNEKNITDISEGWKALGDRGFGRIRTDFMTPCLQPK